MRVLGHAREFHPAGRPVAAAIGVFDGVHLGHQQVIRQSVTDARLPGGAAVVVTFDRHPNTVVAPDRVPPMIYSRPQKLRALEALGVDATLEISFTAEFAGQAGEDFVRELASSLAPLRSVSVGRTFVFGRRRSGDVALLERLGAELGFAVHGLPAVTCDGEAVSSTRIREAIRAGDLRAASRWLGREYALAGVVQRGDALGRQLGFPTANVAVSGLLVPPLGVYVAEARFDGRTHPAAVNIGVRPTVGRGAPELRVEAHLVGFEGDLYGRELELVFREKLRGEQKFPSLEALREQIARDVAVVRSRA